MDWVEEGDHLVLSRLTERGRPLLINDICCKSPKAEIKYFCLNATFVSFAAVEKGICQNPQALAKGGFPLGARWELLPTFTLMAFSVPILYLESTFHPFTFTTYFEYGIVHFLSPLAVWQFRVKRVFLFFSRKTRDDLACMKGSDFWWHLCLCWAHGRSSGGFTGWVGLPFVLMASLTMLEQNRLRLLRRLMVTGPGRHPVLPQPLPLLTLGYHYPQCVTSDSLGQALKQSILHNLENQPSLQKQRGNIGNKDGYIIWRQTFFHAGWIICCPEGGDVDGVEGKEGESQGTVRG